MIRTQLPVVDGFWLRFRLEHLLLSCTDLVTKPIFPRPRILVELKSKPKA